mgnify:CR=1 FL=1
MAGREPDKKGIVCSRCGSEDAVVIRKYSGEALCHSCLRKSLLARMRRAVSRYGLLKRDDSIIFVRTGLPRDPVLWDLFYEMEREFPVTIDQVVLNVADVGELWSSLPDLSREVESERGKVVIPLLLDDVVALFLRFIFTGVPDILMLRGKLYLVLREVKEFISPFVEVPLDELLALSGKERAPPVNPYLRIVEELEKAHPGMRFNIMRMLDRVDLLRSIGIVFR